jgi:hypothetical protein
MNDLAFLEAGRPGWAMAARCARIERPSRKFQPLQHAATEGWLTRRLVGALLSGFLFVETALADARSGLRGPWQLQLLALLAVTFPWTIPLIAGSIAFTSALKLDAKAESSATPH